MNLDLGHKSIVMNLMKKENLVLLIILFVAFFLRSWDIGWNGFNGDESIYSGQAASLLGEKEFLKDFAVFRAHPLLVQSMVSFVFAVFGIQDVVARIIPVIFGSLTVFLTYLTGKELFDKRTGLICSLILAILPFHVIFSRQVILDVPLSFFVTLFLYFVARYQMTGKSLLCYWIGVSCALCVLSKEVGAIMIVIFIAYTIITRTLNLNKLKLFGFGFASSFFPFILLMVTKQEFRDSIYYYGIFQFSRGEVNIFSPRYSTVLIHEAFGYVLLFLMALSVFLIWRHSRMLKSRRYLDGVVLLVLTLSILFVCYQLLPSKGDRFMITFVPPAVILGCSFLVLDPLKGTDKRILAYISIIPLVILSSNFFLSKALPIEDLKISDNLGTPWKRELAIWIKDNSPKDSAILTDHMPLANIIRFYSNRDVYTVEVSSNPSYIDVDNPALLILNKNITLIVQDLDPKFSNNRLNLELEKYVEFFDPKLIYTAYRHEISNGTNYSIPAMKVYQMR